MHWMCLNAGMALGSSQRNVDASIHCLSWPSWNPVYGCGDFGLQVQQEDAARPFSRSGRSAIRTNESC